jgi:hypothetical protein
MVTVQSARPQKPQLTSCGFLFSKNKRKYKEHLTRDKWSSVLAIEPLKRNLPALVFLCKKYRNSFSEFLTTLAVAII